MSDRPAEARAFIRRRRVGTGRSCPVAVRTCRRVAALRRWRGGAPFQRPRPCPGGTYRRLRDKQPMKLMVVWIGRHPESFDIS